MTMPSFLTVNLKIMMLVMVLVMAALDVRALILRAGMEKYKRVVERMSTALAVMAPIYYLLYAGELALPVLVLLAAAEVIAIYTLTVFAPKEKKK